jgi:adenosine deaminase
MTLPLAVFEKLPKTDLHVHLDGSLRIETMLDLAQQRGVRLPADTPEGLRKAMHCGENTGSLVEYLKAFDITLSVMQTEDALFRTAYEVAEDAAKENVRYMELRYAPMLHARNGLRMVPVVEAVLAGLRQAEKDHGIESRVIICGIRNISTDSSIEMARLAVAYKNRGVVAFDLAGAEYDHPAKHHRDAFQLIRNNNLNCTIHAGEAFGPESIAQAIHVCGAHRIGHGCRLREDGDLLHYVNDNRITLEVCPSSNVQTGAVASLAAHPLKLYYDLGVRVTVNTDNRLITDTTVSKELWHCHKEMGLGAPEIARIVLNGFKASFMPFHIKQSYLRRISEELSGFVKDPISILPEPMRRETAHSEHPRA